MIFFSSQFDKWSIFLKFREDYLRTLIQNLIQDCDFKYFDDLRNIDSNNSKPLVQTSIIILNHLKTFSLQNCMKYFSICNSFHIEL